MNPEADSTPANCNYCGKANPDRLSSCAACGTVLVAPVRSAEPRRGKKSRLLAVSLAILLGPLGLIYVGAWVPAAAMILISLPFRLTYNGNVWVAIGSRMLAALWAYCAVIEGDEAPNVNRDSKRLLDQAAQFENTDKIRAIAVYEQIIHEYPDTAASREAARNIETIARQKA